MSMCKLSGVVIKNSGGFSFCFNRCLADVSPDLTPTCHDNPNPSMACFAENSISLLKARMGVIQITCNPTLRLGFGSD